MRDVPKLAVIVEGQGEIAAVPVLLQRIAAAASHATPPRVHPFRVPRQKVVQPSRFENVIELAARSVAPRGSILVLLDADENCPAKLGPDLLARARRARGDLKIRVVLAKPEFEAWFIGAAESIAGKCGLRADLRCPSNPEDRRNAKGWLSRHMPHRRSYKPMQHQKALAGVFDIEAARKRAPSFDKFCRDVEGLLASASTPG